MEYPIFSFSYFVCGGHFENAQDNFPVNIIDSYSIGCKLAEECKFVDLWEGCMMGRPTLQPNKICIHDGPEIMFLGLFLRGSLAKF